MWRSTRLFILFVLFCAAAAWGLHQLTQKAGPAAPGVESSAGPEDQRVVRDAPDRGLSLRPLGVARTDAAARTKGAAPSDAATPAEAPDDKRRGSASATPAAPVGMAPPRVLGRDEYSAALAATEPTLNADGHPVAPGLRPDDRFQRGVEERDAAGSRQRRIWTVRRPDFKHPLIRVVEHADGRVDEMVADHLLVRPAAGVDLQRLDAAVAPLGGRVRDHKRISKLVLIAFDPGAGNAGDERFRGMQRALAALPEVALVAEDAIVYPSVTPDDPMFGDLWGLHNTGQDDGTEDADIDAPEAWEVTTGSSDVVVAVIDTGITRSHPDLAGNLWTNPDEIPDNGIDDDGNGYIDDVHGWDFVDDDNDPEDNHGHGTHCAGTISAVGNDGDGIVGVCWDVSLVSLKMLDTSGGTVADATEALSYAAAMGFHVTSNSWGGGVYSQTIYDAVAALGAADILCIAAAGNSELDADQHPMYPAAYDLDNIISVAASDRNDELAYFSNWGRTTVDLSAPGVAITSSYKDGDYKTWSGTSMATPHVAGTAALLKSLDTDMPAAFIKRYLFDTVDPISDFAGIMTTGGRLNAGAALGQVLTGDFTAGLLYDIDDDTNGASDGNGNGYMEAGETVALDLQFANFTDQTLDGVSVHATLVDDHVTLLDAGAVLGEVDVGSAVTRDEALLLSIAADCPSQHQVTLVSTITCSAGSVTHEHTFTIYHSRLIAGTVTRDGEPLENAEVTWSGPLNGFTTTGADGTYAVVLPDLTLALSCDHADAMAVAPRRTLAPGDDASEEDFAFNTYTLSGTVTDKAEGWPVEGALIRVSDAYTDGAKPIAARAWSDENGDYLVELLLPDGFVGDYSFTCSSYYTEHSHQGYVTDDTYAIPPSRTYDFEMERHDLEYSVDSLVVQVVQGQTKDVAFSISNTGSQDALWFLAPELTPYRLSTSYHDGDPVYDYQSIAAVGTDITQAYVDAYAAGSAATGRALTIDLPFTMPYFEDTSDQIYLGPGYLTLDPVVESENTENTGVMPNHARPSSCVAFLSKWFENSDPGGKIYKYQRDADTFVIEYDRLRDSPDDDNRNSVQVILQRDGTIFMQWKRIDDQGFISMGIQDQASLNGLSICYQQGANFDFEEQAVRIDYLPSEGDYSQSWMRCEPGDGTIQAVSSQEIVATFDATHLEPGIYDTTLRARDISSQSGPFDSETHDIPVRMQVVSSAGGPIAHAGFDARATIGETVVLDGSLSTATGGGELSFTWEQVSGPRVLALEAADSAKPSFHLPRHLAAIGVYEFRMTVEEDGIIDTDLVSVRAHGVNVALHSGVISNQTQIDEGWEPSRAVDGKKSTDRSDLLEHSAWYAWSAWHPDDEDAIRLDIDLGRTCRIDELGVLFRQAGMDDMRLSYLDGDGNWTDLCEDHWPKANSNPPSYPPAHPGETWFHYPFAQVTAQYLRLTWDEPPFGSPMYLLEAEIYGLAVDENHGGRAIGVQVDPSPQPTFEVQPDMLPLESDGAGGQKVEGLHPDLDHTIITVPSNQG